MDFWYFRISLYIHGRREMAEYTRAHLRARACCELHKFKQICCGGAP